MIINLAGSIVIDIKGSIVLDDGGASQEFIVNGTFDTDTNWSKGSGWTIADGQAVGGDSGEFLTQTMAGALTTSSGYELTFDVTNLGFDTVTIRVGNQIIYSDIPNGVGVSVPFTANNTHSTFSVVLDAGNYITLDNVSIVPT